MAHEVREVPGFGAGAYLLLAKPLRDHRALAFIVFDRLLREVPASLYWRLHVAALLTWSARPSVTSSRPSVRAIVPAIRERLAAMNGHWLLISAVLAVNAIVLAAAGMLFQRDISWALSEFGPSHYADAKTFAVSGVVPGHTSPLLVAFAVDVAAAVALNARGSERCIDHAIYGPPGEGAVNPRVNRIRPAPRRSARAAA